MVLMYFLKINGCINYFLAFCPAPFLNPALNSHDFLAYCNLKEHKKQIKMMKK